MNKLIYLIKYALSITLWILLVALWGMRPAFSQSVSVSGKVLNEKGASLPGVTISVKGTTNGTITNEEGIFVLQDVGREATLLISSIGFEKKEIKLKGETYITIILKPQANQLDETVIMAYGTTTRRLNTGDISTVTANEIAQQPVSNPLAALEGRVPGLLVTQSNGVPGSSFKVQIRGQNSIAQGSEPLFIIDGVPFAPGNSSITQMVSQATPTGTTLGLSPFNSINPSDIESIEVLKDADATAIYGSRGANGVILITTKKGKPGKTAFNINVYSGISTVTRTMNMLNTKEYLQMRREAFYNDGETPDVSSAPDLLAWDTTRYTNFKKLLIGGTAHTTEAQISMSGGSATTQFFIGGGYHHTTTVFPGDMADNRGSMIINLNHHSENNKFQSIFSANFSSDKNNLIADNLAAYISLPPDLPSLFDGTGKLNWQQGGVLFDNPLASLLDTYLAQTDNLLSHLQLSYELLPGFSVKSSFGYNSMWVKETSLLPAAAQNPEYQPEGYSQFGNSSVNSWIIEPQIQYSKNIGKGELTVLGGMTFQQILNNSDQVEAYGYTNDALLGSMTAASSIQATNQNSEYRYDALFGRINYNWDNKYILNISGRRDGSSRFGTGKQFANFAAAGVAWIFSDNHFMKKDMRFLSFGKLRGSYGVTGNDQIGDYQYLDSWKVTNFPYQNSPGLTPASLFNPDYSWEVNRKLEAAVELGFLENRIMTTISYYRNRSGNQLIQYQLPSQTGFRSIIENFPAVVQNSGLESTLSFEIFSTNNFHWTSSIDLTIPSNKLVAFPGIKNSSYAFRYVIGKSLNLLYDYRFKGVSPSTGIYNFEDANGDGKFNTSDYQVNGFLNPRFYGGFNNVIGFKNLQFSFFFSYRKQLGENYLGYINTPGTMYNQPVEILNRWKYPGEKTDVQKFTQDYGDAYFAQYYLTASNGIYSDASFIRLKNISLAYNLPSSWIKSVHIESCRIYGEGQNLITITDYKGSDPETQNFYTLPTLKTFVLGIQLIF